MNGRRWGDESGRPRWSLADNRPATDGDLSATSGPPPGPQRDSPLAETARRAHAQQPGGRRRGDAGAGDGVLSVTATVNWGRSVTFTCTGHAHSSSNRNISLFAAGGNLVADSGCGRTPGRCCTARSASRPTAHRKCAARRAVLPADVARTLPLASLATGSGADAQTARDR